MSNIWFGTGGSLLGVVEKYLPNSSYELRVAFDSPLSIVSLASLRNSGYCFASAKLGMNDVAHFLSTRVSYLEAVTLSLVSLVHHVFFACVYTGLTIGTVGFSKGISNDCTRHWYHVFYSAMSIAIGVVGTIAPYYGSLCNAGAFLYIWNHVKENYSTDLDYKEERLVNEIRGVLVGSWNEIVKSIEGWVNDDWDFKQNYKPALELVRDGLDKAETMDRLFNAFYKGKELYVQRTSLDKKHTK